MAKQVRFKPIRYKLNYEHHENEKAISRQKYVTAAHTPKAKHNSIKVKERVKKWYEKVITALENASK